MTAIRIEVDHAKLQGRLLLPQAGGERCPGVLFVHGWGSSQRQDLRPARRLVAHAHACLTFNLRGHAHTRRDIAEVTRAQNLRDVAAAYDILACQPTVDPERIAVVGASYGGYLAVLLTTERTVRWIALQAPALYKDADFDRPKRELNLDPDLATYRRTRLAPEENLALRAAAAFGGPVLVVEPEHDTVIPHPVVANYLTAFGVRAAPRHVVLHGADHGLTDPRCRRAYERIVVDWLLQISREP